MSDLGNREVFSRNLQRYMDLNHLSRSDVCAALGFKYSTFTDWVNGNKYPRIDKIEMLANYFGVEKSDLIENKRGQKASDSPVLPDNIMPMPKTYKIPLLGTIACGEPILAAENIEDEVEIPEHIHADFALRCKGDSMINARIHDGDIVYIRQQPAVNNGEIAAVLIDEEATLKRVYVHSDHIVLQPENPSFDPLVYFGEAMEQIRILGKAVGFTSRLS